MAKKKAAKKAAPPAVIVPPAPTPNVNAPNSSNEPAADLSAAGQTTAERDAQVSLASAAVVSSEQGRACTNCGTIHAVNRCDVCGKQLVDDP